MSVPTSRRLLAALAVTTFVVPGATAATADAKPLKRGTHGARVKVLQRDLGLSPADGIFGKGTYKAVRRFQRRHRLTVDGIVGTVTWRLVHGSPAPPSPSAGGSSGGARVQRRGSSFALLQRKIGIGADGVFGQGPASAVKRFQRAHG